jgi:hypothetical protein
MIQLLTASRFLCVLVASIQYHDASGTMLVRRRIEYYVVRTSRPEQTPKYKARLDLYTPLANIIPEFSSLSKPAGMPSQASTVSLIRTSIECLVFV